MEEIIKLIVDNGIGLVCVAVVIYDHLVSQKKTVNIMEKMTEALHNICNRITKIEDKLEIKECDD